MIHKKILSSLVVTAFAAAAIVGAMTVRSAFAQTDTPPNDDTPGQALPAGPGTRGGPHAARDGQALADALGIDLEDLQAAQQTARDAAIDQAVEEGSITQEQADQMKSDSEQKPGFGMRLKGIDTDALLADALGISVEELQAAREEARAAQQDEAITNGEITQDQVDRMNARQALSSDETFKSSMQSAYQQALAQAVSDGVITQAQADLLLAENDGSTGGFLPGDGGHGGPGGPGGPARGENNPRPAETPEATE